jgi:hypothetical protein
VPLAGAVEEALARLRRAAATQESPDGTATLDGGTTMFREYVTPEEMPKVTTGTVPVSPALADAIRRMGTLLEAELGCDFAFVVMGGGGLIAGDNSRDGVVMPLVRPVTPPESK